MNRRRLEEAVQRAEPWVVAVALGCTGWALLATQQTCLERPEQRASFVARGACGSARVEHVTDSNGCSATATLLAPEHLRLPATATPMNVSGEWRMTGPVVLERDDAGIVTLEVSMDCWVTRSGGPITRNPSRPPLDGGLVEDSGPPLPGDGGDPNTMLCDCTSLGTVVRDLDGGDTGTRMDAGDVACDYVMDTQ